MPTPVPNTTPVTELTEPTAVLLVLQTPPEGADTEVKEVLVQKPNVPKDDVGVDGGSYLETGRLLLVFEAPPLEQVAFTL
mgnify:CR=1 FL=1